MSGLKVVYFCYSYLILSEVIQAHFPKVGDWLVGHGSLIEQCWGIDKEIGWIPRYVFTL